MSHTHGIIARYREHLSFAENDPIISLGEGGTPLVQAPYLSKVLGSEVWLKLEGANPTGSFKDRGMTCAISAAYRDQATTVICASTGNTSASAAAYAAKAGLKAVVLIPEGKIALGKLAQSLIYGAQVIALPCNFDGAASIAKEMAEQYPITLVNSINPFRLEGQKTSAFEILEDLPDFDLLAIPIGNGGNITSYHKGFTEMSTNPVLFGFQAEGAAPLVNGAPVEDPETVASAIRIGNPARWHEAMQALETSGGKVRAVTDKEILAAHSLLASKEGIFCEPASAATIAGLLRYGTEGAKQVVCVLTGNGLKDPDTAIKQLENPHTCAANLEAVAETIFT
jgi:threonine synthase